MSIYIRFRENPKEVGVLYVGKWPVVPRVGETIKVEGKEYRIVKVEYVASSDSDELSTVNILVQSIE